MQFTLKLKSRDVYVYELEHLGLIRAFNYTWRLSVTSRGSTSAIINATSR